VLVKLSPDKPARFALKFRIPHWSRATRVNLNGKPIGGVKAGDYLALERTWRRGDAVEIDFDFSLRYWVGERECASKTSVYRGPLLLTYDRRFNTLDPDEIPPLDAATMRGRNVPATDWLPPMLLMEFATTDGKTVRLCDFGSAGVGGSPYRSWLTIRNVTPTEFSRANPLRSAAIQ
jgi:hypothetical protein